MQVWLFCKQNATLVIDFELKCIKLHKQGFRVNDQKLTI